MGGCPNVLNYSFVNAQPMLGLTYPKTCYFFGNCCFLPLSRGAPDPEVSTQTGLLRVPDLATSPRSGGSAYFKTTSQHLAHFRPESDRCCIAECLCGIDHRSVVEPRFWEFYQTGALYRSERSSRPRGQVAARLDANLADVEGLGCPGEDRLARAPSTATLFPTALSDRVTDACPVCEELAHSDCHLCGSKFCHQHVYVCLDCDIALCGGCTDLHITEGHWSDSDTSREMAASIMRGAR
jgi:hypothetical protein